MLLTDAVFGSRHCRRVLLVALVLTRATAAFAQTAEISGVVRDSTGAVVTGASLVLESEMTGLRREVRTNDEGLYALPALNPGSYRLTVDARAFRQLTRRNIALTVGQRARLDVVLDVAAVEDRVSVEGGIPVVNMIDATVGTTLDRRAVENLPLNGRTFQSLITLSPGVVLTPTTGSGGQFSVNGQRSTANYFTIDGVSANIGADPRGIGGVQASGSLPGVGATGGTNNLVSMEAFQEVKILTSSFAPEHGRTPGAQVAIVTRSGSNDLAGSAFEYFRHEALDATDWFTNSRGEQKPKTRFNNFGGVVGGPLVQNRLFYFASHESQRLQQPRSVLTEVPSLSAREQALPSVRPILEAFPQPNGRALDADSAEFGASFSQPNSLDTTSIRVDAATSRGGTIFGRVSASRSSNEFRGGSSGTPGAMSVVDHDNSRTLTVTAGNTAIVRSRIISDLRLNFSRHRVHTESALDDFGGAVPFDQSLLEAPSGPSGALTRVTMLTGRAGGFLLLGNDGGSTQRQFNAVWTVAAQAGRHGLKGGVDFRQLTPELSPATMEYRYGFNTVRNAIGGRLPTVTLSLHEPAAPRFSNWSFFLQDTWQIARRLTATYGMRYEFNPAPSPRDDRHPLLADYAALPSAVVLRPQGSRLWDSGTSNVAPRVGLAYVLSDKPAHELVVRGGWGLYYDLGVGRSAGAFGDGAPFAAERRLTNAIFPLTPSELIVAPPVAGQPQQAPVWAFPSALSLPRTHQWNVTFEKGLGQATSATLAIVGAHGRRLLSARSYDFTGKQQPATIVYAVSDDASSDYHALQAQVQRRVGRLLQGTVSYTWGHAIDTASDEFLFQTERNVDDLTQSRGNADFDIRHAATAMVSLFGPVDARGSLLRRVVSDWQIDTVLTFRSGPPITPRSVRDLGFGRFLFRPDVVHGVPQYLDVAGAPGGSRVNPAAFSVPTENRQGDLGRNTIRGSALRQVDAALSRTFPVGSALRMQLRLEVFNVFNTPNFGLPLATLSSPLFGLATTTYANSLGTGALARGGLNPLFQTGGPRATQLAVRMIF